MAKKSNKLTAMNMTQIDAEAEGGAVVISGNNVFASGSSVRVNVRSASVVSGISVQTGISVSSCGNVSISNSDRTLSLGALSGEVYGDSDDDGDNEAVYYEDDEKGEDDAEDEEEEDEEGYDIDEDN